MRNKVVESIFSPMSCWEEAGIASSPWLLSDKLKTPEKEKTSLPNLRI